jgi:hypothetical protein
MRKHYSLVLLSLFTLAGCASQNQILDNDQAMAVQTAVSRGQFDLQCPTAMGTVLSREMVQPAMQGPWVNGIQRGKFTVGVEGCGRRKS